MNTRRLTLLVVAVVLVLSATYIVNARRADTAATGPVSVGLEDSIPAAHMKSTAELIDFWRERFERSPQDYISVSYLGQSFMRRARETGDMADYERAETALRKALDLNPDYEVALAYLAAVQYTKHDFADALALAQRVYTTDPQALQALATMGDAQLELGNYVEAAAAYHTLSERIPSPPVYSRQARLNWLQGHPQQAIDLMRQAVDEAEASELTGEGLAWYQFQLGELYYGTGQTDAAGIYYAQALATFDNYYLALGGLAKVHAAQGDYAEAIKLYERAVAIIPQPDLLAALGDVYALKGQSAQAQQEYDTVEFIGKLAAINRVVYNRQLALFYANHNLHVDTALQLSTDELATRKDIYAYDAAAWALYKTGNYRAAAGDMQQALRLGTRDALLYYHAGMIQAALGDSGQAKTLLSEALSINPHFDLRQAEVARAELARLGVEGK